jgi:hypothetical protein
MQVCDLLYGLQEPRQADSIALWTSVSSSLCLQMVTDQQGELPSLSFLMDLAYITCSIILAFQWI